MANTHVLGVSGSVQNPRRQAICEDAVVSILDGQTMADIAARHNVGRSTLALWLANMDGYEQLRQVWCDAQLADAQQMLMDAPDQLELARARELLRSAQWIAERRDARYRPKQEVQQDTTITVVLDPGAGRVLESYPQADRVTDGADPLDVVPMAELPNK